MAQKSATNYPVLVFNNFCNFTTAKKHHAFAIHTIAGNRKNKTAFYIPIKMNTFSAHKPKTNKAYK
jgi:hypothetical protein